MPTGYFYRWTKPWYIIHNYYHIDKNGNVHSEYIGSILVQIKIKLNINCIGEQLHIICHCYIVITVNQSGSTLFAIMALKIKHKTSTFLHMAQ